MLDAGYIYVLINHSMIDLVKVGKTTRDTESRAKELSSVTGVPTPFIVAFDAYFTNCSKAEDHIHNKLEQRGYRLSSNREFFQAPLKEVIAVILEAQQLFKSHFDSSDEVNGMEQLDEEVHVDLQKEPWSEIESLATYYFNSDNFEEAYKLYSRAKDLGSKTAYLFIGMMTLWGRGCLEDEKEATTILEEGVRNGDSRCCGELAMYYFYKNPTSTL